MSQMNTVSNLIGCPECSRTREFYAQLREYKELPTMEKLDVTLQIAGNLWGYTLLVLIPLMVGALFWKHVYDWAKSRGFSISLTKGKP